MVNLKKHYYKLPFWFKLWWAKQFIYMFRGFGSTFDNDIILYNELTLWIETKGKPNSKLPQKTRCLLRIERRRGECLKYLNN